MTELNFAIERVSQALQALGLMLPALACCYAQFTRQGGLKYFEKSNYYNKTGINLLEFLKQKFHAHDHEVKGIKPKKDQLVVEIRADGPIGEEIDKVLVNRDDVATTDFLKEGERIPESSLIHKHSGTTEGVGPWEHQ